MPEQKSERGERVTSSAFEAPFETPIVPLGVGGLDLASALDKIATGRFARLTNCFFTPGESRELTARPGQTELATAAGTHHSIVRMNDPQVLDFTRLFGVGTKLYRGKNGALAEIDDTYSGNPLVMLPHRPPLSGDPWTFIADSARMQKIRFDGLNLPIGLPAPGVAATVGLGPEQLTHIASFDQVAFPPDGTGGQFWTINTGFDFSDPPQPTGTASTFVDSGTFSIIPSAAVGASKNGFYSFWGLALTRDLSKVGALDASDDDFIHFTIQFGGPRGIAEARVYFVVSETFSPSIIPGTNGEINADFYVKSFRPADFTDWVSGLNSQVNTAEAARVINVRQQSLSDSATQKGYEAIRPSLYANPAFQQVDPANPESVIPIPVVRSDTGFIAVSDPVRDQSFEVGGTDGEFVELGKVGRALRRGDFKRYGERVGRDWSTVTGMIIFLRGNGSTGAGGIFVTVYDMSLTGGNGPDTADPAAQSYDYRYTHYDPRTGAEGNPSPVMDASNFIDALRREILVQPAPYGDAAVRQRFYRRGGALTGDWYSAGENDSDGGAFHDTESDLGIAAADTVKLDHFEPVPTVDDSGNTVLAQPVPVLIGPYNGQLIALGDPYRPGHIYLSLPEAPDHWPPDLAYEVCPPSEELMNGCMFAGQPIVFSRLMGHTLYANLAGQSGMTATPNGCKRGLAGRWAITVGYGYIWFVSNDGVYRMTGGPEELISADLWPIFHGQEKSSYRPIDFGAEPALRLGLWQNELYFAYQDDQGNVQTMVYQIATGQWRHYVFANEPACFYQDEGDSSLFLIGARNTGKSYTHSGTSDDTAVIAGKFRTGSWDWSRPREEKLFGDQFLDLDSKGVDITLRNFVNTETVVNGVQALTIATGRNRAIFDGFGTGPQLGRNLATEITWQTAADPPVFYFMGVSITSQPDLTMKRVTNWDDLSYPDEKYVTGITLDCDTGGIDRTILIEVDLNGSYTVIATLTVHALKRHKLVFSWPAAQANQVRIRPDDDCKAWLLYRADWIWTPEPPRISKWDVHFENAWDQYYTGLDLYCDTFNLIKRVEVWVDEIRLTDGRTGLPYWEIQADGRKVRHITLPWGRGHVFRFVAIDDNPGLLYSHRWHLDDEPSEQANWNQNFSPLGTLADKWLKAVVFECDTFGQNKSVEIQADGVTVETLTVNTDGRKVVQIALSDQKLGRIWRMFPVDYNPGRLYSAIPVFDVEPYQLDRWETQEQDHDLDGFFSVIDTQVSIKSSADVTLTIQYQLNQEDPLFTSDAYVIPATGGRKAKRYVPLLARKGVMVKYLFTSASPFWLYREESTVRVQPWGSDSPIERHMWGNDDQDRTRGMTFAPLAAARSGGGAGAG